jgi:hypothetical protein
MTGNRVEDEKNLTSALITALASLKEPPTKDVITEKARGMAALFGYEGDLEPIINEAMIAVDSRMGAGVSLVDIHAEHDEKWVFKRKEIKWAYSEAYEKYLKTQRWHPTLVHSLSDVGTRILGHLQDPSSEGSWNRRGLVIGHVQSGKTANYIGLVAKAADAGYKFIIVIAGIHNNLRKQTQERIDEGFIGRSSDPNNRVLAGVGLNGGYPHPATLTTVHEDFNKNTAEKSGWRINDFSKPIILVIKKNVRTLDALHKWLKELNTQGDGKIADVPMLLIDDEADNASINTNKDDLNPTRTNAMIRRILGLFAKSCYLGYTATPFANIFINPDAYDSEVYDELFPRDFIYCLDAPNTYFGPDKVFLDQVTSSTVTEAITDCEEYIPWSHKKDYPTIELPPSLYRALHQFVLVRAIRNLRGHSGKHCSMMINVSRFVAVQKSVRDLISLHEKKLREAVKANYSMPEEFSEKNQYMFMLKEVFEGDFTDCGFTWSQVKKSLWSVFDNLRAYVINSKTDESLDYKKYEQDGHSLAAIAIGGLSLSRGLTIEGLCVSYMYRNTRMYDTLMQMGRWFGYRLGYEDLCRVHLSPDSIDWYSHIADASEELRQQIKRMRRDGLSPRQFGLYVRAHPDSLLITAANKMRGGEKVKFRQNFSGRILESYLLPVDNQTNRENEHLIAKYWKSGFGGGSISNKEKGWFVPDVNVEVIEEFLNKFQVHSDFYARKSAIIDYLQLLADKCPVGDVLLISIKENDEDAANWRLGLQKRASAKRQNNAWRVSKDRVASRGDEKIGLSPVQMESAKKLVSDDGGKDPSDFHYRTIRNKPLLMVHVLECEEESRVPAFGLSFPPGHYETEIEVVANKVWIEKVYGPMTDNPDDEDDFDD